MTKFVVTIAQKFWPFLQSVDYTNLIMFANLERLAVVAA